MEDFDILDETDILQERRLNKRPVFILVLCILTWVGSGLSLFSSLFGWWAISATKRITSNIGNGLGSNVGQEFDRYYNLLSWQYIATIVACILCSLGAFFMFKLKKVGFVVYLVGQLLTIAFMFLVALSVPNELGLGVMKGLSMTMTVAGAIFPIAFIAMYGANLKYMK